jgi:hypothetical protein
MYANIVATLALVLAMSGTAYAAGKISGKQIAKNAIASKHIKNGSVRAVDLAADAKAATTGPTGPTGATGPAGPQGLQGAPGLSGYEIVAKESGVSDYDGWTHVSVTCPAGKRAIGYGTRWRNVGNTTTASQEGHATVTLNIEGTGYTAYGKAGGTALDNWLTLQVICVHVD